MPDLPELPKDRPTDPEHVTVRPPPLAPGEKEQKGGVPETVPELWREMVQREDKLYERIDKFEKNFDEFLRRINEKLDDVQATVQATKEAGAVSMLLAAANTILQRTEQVARIERDQRRTVDAIEIFCESNPGFTPPI